MGAAADLGYPLLHFPHRLVGPLRKAPDFIRDHGEAAAVLAGPRRFDGGVERRRGWSGLAISSISARTSSMGLTVSPRPATSAAQLLDGVARLDHPFQGAGNPLAAKARPAPSPAGRPRRPGSTRLDLADRRASSSETAASCSTCSVWRRVCPTSSSEAISGRAVLHRFGNGDLHVDEAAIPRLDKGVKGLAPGRRKLRAGKERPGSVQVAGGKHLDHLQNLWGGPASLRLGKAVVSPRFRLCFLLCCLLAFS